MRTAELHRRQSAVTDPPPNRRLRAAQQLRSLGHRQVCAAALTGGQYGHDQSVAVAPSRFLSPFCPRMTSLWRPRNDETPALAGASWKVSDGTRTRDRLDHNQELYLLSYAHHACRCGPGEGRPALGI